MNVGSILGYKRDPREDYYGILGCSRTSTEEQILAEFKVRARWCHPDKQGPASSGHQEFQDLLQAKETLTDPAQRNLYDRWLDAGLALSFRTWRGLKGSVRMSTHWATPRTDDRMIQLLQGESGRPGEEEEDPLPSGGQGETGGGQGQGDEDLEDPDDEDDGDDGVSYEPTPYDSLRFRMATPPPEWGLPDGGGQNDDLASVGGGPSSGSAAAAKDDRGQPRSTMEEVAAPGAKPQVVEGAAGCSRGGSTGSSAGAASVRRKQFMTTRRESSIGAMVLTVIHDDQDMRQRFRNNEI